MLIAAYLWVTGALAHAPSAVDAGRQAMLFFGEASVALLYLLGRRLGLARWSTVIGVLVFSLSPLALSYRGQADAGFRNGDSHVAVRPLRLGLRAIRRIEGRAVPGKGARGCSVWGRSCSPSATSDDRFVRAVFAYAFTAVAILRPGYLPLLYVIAMLPFPAICIAGGVDTLWNWRPELDLRRLVILASAVPSWAKSDHYRLSANDDGTYLAAEHWVEAHVPRYDRILVDDDAWVDLVRAGFPPNQVVWFYKLGTDPEVDGRFPDGWRDFQYVIAGHTVRYIHVSTTMWTIQALDHSRVVATFGTGAWSVEVMKVDSSRPVEGAPPQTGARASRDSAVSKPPVRSLTRLF